MKTKFIGWLIGSATMMLLLPCETGQHLYLLSQLGYQVWGSDYSHSMLKIAEKNLHERGCDILLKQCDFRYLERTLISALTRLYA